MSRNNFFFTLIFLGVFIGLGCRKEYPENPKTLPYSDAKLKTALIGNWVVKEFTIDGMDSTENLPFPMGQIYTINEEKNWLDFHTSGPNSIGLGGTISAQKKKEGGRLITELSLVQRINDSIFYLPPQGPFLNKDTLVMPPLNGQF